MAPLRDHLFRRTRSFTFGFFLPFRAGKRILSDKRLLFWSSLPVALTTALYVLVISKAQAEARNALTGYLAGLGLDPQGWAAWGLLVLSQLLLFLVSALTFSIVSGILASPFNDFLAESAERFSHPPLPAVKEQSFRQKVRHIFIDLAKTVAAGMAAILALVFSWIPLLNLVAFGLAFVLIAFQYVSYAQTRRGVRLGPSLGFLWRHSYACMGFGACCSLLFAIPLLSALAIPLAVVGGTLLVGRAPGAGKDLLPLK